MLRGGFVGRVDISVDKLIVSKVIAEMKPENTKHIHQEERFIS